MRTRRTKITVETHRVVLISDLRPAEALWCGLCGALTSWMRPDQAAAIIDVSTRKIYRWVEENRLHFVETPTRVVLVCLDSLCDCSAGTDLDSENISDS